jgi:hypothetical protein
MDASHSFLYVSCLFNDPTVSVIKYSVNSSLFKPDGIGAVAVTSTSAPCFRPYCATLDPIGQYVYACCSAYNVDTDPGYIMRYSSSGVASNITFTFRNCSFDFRNHSLPGNCQISNRFYYLAFISILYYSYSDCA